MDKYLPTPHVCVAVLLLINGMTPLCKAGLYNLLINLDYVHYFILYYLRHLQLDDWSARTDEKIEGIRMMESS